MNMLNLADRIENFTGPQPYNQPTSPTMLIDLQWNALMFCMWLEV